jgi:branched-chain amino acid transport system substrate-binding protein
MQKKVNQQNTRIAEILKKTFHKSTMCLGDATEDRRGTQMTGIVKSLIGAAAAVALLTGVSARAADDKIVIGGALSLTGLQAPLDTPGFKGAQVAVKYLNDNGDLLGKQVEFINIDGKSDPVTVGNVAVELVDQGAQMILAPCDFDFGSPASREAQAADIVGLSTCASDPLYSSWTLGDKQFTLSMWNTTMGAVGADFAAREKGWKTAYVVTDQFIAYTKSLSKYFVAQFKANGGEILLEDTYTNGDNNFSAQLARLKALGRKPDVIFVSSYGTDIGVIIRALREVGYDAPVLGGDAYDDPALHAALGEQMGNGVYFVTHTWMGPEAHPDMPKFIGLYKQMFGEDPDTSFVATGWDSVMMLAQAVKAAGSTDGEDVAEALEEGEFKLLTGDLNYGTAEEGHAPDKAAVLIELKGGKPQFLGWRRPASVPAP